MTVLNVILKPSDLFEVRDYKLVAAEDDHRIRLAENYLYTKKVILQSGGVTFAMKGNMKFKGSKRVCTCSWDSAHCTFQFHYDVFEVKSPHHRFYVYLETLVFLQKCRKHLEYATQVHLEENSLAQMCEEFATLLHPKRLAATMVENIEEKEVKCVGIM